MNLSGKHILVVGLAKTGLALTRFLFKAGARVTVSDMAAAADLAEHLEEIRDLSVTLEIGVPQPHCQGFDIILLSPGVPPELPWIEAARLAGTPVWGELELASYFIRLPILAVTGTNGKTTTTSLLGQLLAASGFRPLVGGNIGTPVVELISRQDQGDLLVLEVSSFQLDTAPSFHPHAAALLNITPDHLDRYAGYQAYVASKASLFRHMGPAEVKVLNWDDPLVRPLGRGKETVYYFSAEAALPQGAWVEDGAIRVRLLSGWEGTFPLSDVLLPGRHNQENVMAALLLALSAGADPATCRDVLKTFQGLPHRLEYVATVRGVDFYDDSKGTNVGAVARSLSHFNRPLVLIAGGRDKDSDFSLLSPLIKARVKALVLMGETRDHLARVWEGLAPVYLASDMADAVAHAARLATPGEVVLLSPACASFDMFRDYAHRGSTFQQLVREVMDDHSN